MRIGYGYDAHKFAHGRRLVLGGVDVPYNEGLAAHSDGDVVVHALCDALLGAAGLGDIGQHFPDSHEEFRGIDSRVLLRRVIGLLAQRQLRVHNADMTIVAQAPRLRPYIDSMRSKLANDLYVDASCINIKATTTEGMGFTGRGEGIAVHAVVLLLEAN